MAKRDLTAMGTDAISDGDQEGLFTISKQDLDGGFPAIWVRGLAGTEKVYLWMNVGDASSSWEEVEDNNLQATFSVTQKHFVIATAGDYGMTKDATAGSITPTLEGV